MPTRIVLTRHAWSQIRRRHVPKHVVVAVAARPEQTIRTGSGREIRQSMVPIGGRPYLVRVVVEPSGRDTIVVTVYRTSRVAKYRRSS